MSVFELIFVAAALSMDAVAVSVANCCAFKNLSKSKMWSMPLLFGLFQAVMPLIGFFVGSLFLDCVEPILPLITAALFAFLGIKIIFDILNEKNAEHDKNKKIKASELTFRALMVQALATSVDALAVGVTLYDCVMGAYAAVMIIGAVTFTLVVFALFLEKTFSKFVGGYAQWVGAIILIALAVKNLIYALVK